MFDRFMALSLPLWFMATMTLGLVIAFLLIKAAIRIRQLRQLLNEATREAMEGGRGPTHPWQTTESKDWAAQR